MFIVIYDAISTPYSLDIHPHLPPPNSMAMAFQLELLKPGSAAVPGPKEGDEEIEVESDKSERPTFAPLHWEGKSY